MFGRSIRLLAAAVCVCVTGPSLLARQEISFKPVLKAGQEFSYSLGMVLDVSQKMGEGQPDQLTSLRSGAQIRMKVVEVSAEGSAKLEGVFERAMVQAPIGDQEVGFEWPSNIPAGVEVAPIKRLGETLEKSTVFILVSADGSVNIEGGLEKFAQEAAKLDYPDDRYMGFFTEEKMEAVLTPIFKMDGAPLAPRAVGKGWQTTETVALPPAGAIDVTTDFTFNDADPDVANCFGDVRMILKRPENPAADVATVSLDPGSGGGTKLVFDRRRSILKFRKNSVTIDTNWTLGEKTIAQRQLSVLNITLVD